MCSAPSLQPASDTGSHEEPSKSKSRSMLHTFSVECSPRRPASAIVCLYSIAREPREIDLGKLENEFYKLRSALHNDNAVDRSNVQRFVIVSTLWLTQETCPPHFDTLEEEYATLYWEIHNEPCLYGRNKGVTVFWKRLLQYFTREHCSFQSHMPKRIRHDNLDEVYARLYWTIHNEAKVARQLIKDFVTMKILVRRLFVRNRLPNQARYSTKEHPRVAPILILNIWSLTNGLGKIIRFPDDVYILSDVVVDMSSRRVQLVLEAPSRQSIEWITFDQLASRNPGFELAGVEYI
ncbi:MAG: hypothetical protein LQ343_006101 [Gyalolechia ehrenbergii]|nr:MAG: hypothetical protein LQ343_006101 [Gyalolechia ehrenbergii]